MTPRRAVPWALAWAGLALCPLAAHAEPVALPLARAEIPLWQLGLGGHRVLELRGTIDSALDGSRYDALHALDADGAPLGAPSLLRLPPGTRVLERDAAAHRYVVELPADAPPLARLDACALGRAHWVTCAQARESLSGAIVVSMPGARGVAAVASPTSSSATPGEASFPTRHALGAFAMALLLALWARVRQRPALRLPARARRALRQLRREAVRQGPLFAELADDAERLWREEGVTALRQLHAAAREQRSLRHARAALQHRQREALAALRAVVEALESAVAQLTDHRVRELDDGRLHADTGALRSHLALVLQADREARSL